MLVETELSIQTTENTPTQPLNMRKIIVTRHSGSELFIFCVGGFVFIRTTHPHLFGAAFSKDTQMHLFICSNYCLKKKNNRILMGLFTFIHPFSGNCCFYGHGGWWRLVLGIHPTTRMFSCWRCSWRICILNQVTVWRQFNLDATSM